jgi:hypothetical protein
MPPQPTDVPHAQYIAFNFEHNEKVITAFVSYLLLEQITEFVEKPADGICPGMGLCQVPAVAGEKPFRGALPTRPAISNSSGPLKTRQTAYCSFVATATGPNCEADGGPI